jgi:CMP-2-keto-3-deoxyoctulosonic acid synthetase
MRAFETSEATALTREEMERLRVTWAGSKIQAKLQAVVP